MIVGDQIARAVRRYPDAVAVICEDERYTFQELDERTTRLANALLALGLTHGERVACLLGNSIRCVEVDFALAKAGLVRVSLNPRCTSKELRYILTDSGAHTVIADAGFDALIREVADVAPEIWIRVGGRAGDGAQALDYANLIERAGGRAARVPIRRGRVVLPLLYFRYDRPAERRDAQPPGHPPHCVQPADGRRAQRVRREDPAHATDEPRGRFLRVAMVHSRRHVDHPARVRSGRGSAPHAAV